MMYKPFNVISTIQSFLDSSEKWENFAAWAFGEDFANINLAVCLVERWNELHSDEFEVHTFDQVREDLPKMLEVWRKSDDYQLF